jgi:hypothetical protein|tara:strand:- start:166 stop:417 length:252 start_codon:yes stop_codon:yes gene_type:complete
MYQMWRHFIRKSKSLSKLREGFGRLVEMVAGYYDMVTAGRGSTLLHYAILGTGGVGCSLPVSVFMGIIAMIRQRVGMTNAALL